jgi:hypothetical protein
VAGRVSCVVRGASFDIRKSKGGYACTVWADPATGYYSTDDLPDRGWLIDSGA